MFCATPVLDRILVIILELERVFGLTPEEEELFGAGDQSHFGVQPCVCSNSEAGVNAWNS